MSALSLMFCQTPDKKQGFGVESELMLASLTLCTAGRETKRHHLVFNEHAPRHIQLMSWESGSRSTLPSTGQRMPPIRAHTVVWDLPMVPLGLERDGYSLSEVRCLKFGRWFDESWNVLASMPMLEELDLGAGFNAPLCDARWPPNLLALTLGSKFNKTIKGVQWPPLLARLRFGNGFEQELDGAEWPDSLEEIRLGRLFRHGIDRVRWPPRLKYLRFGKWYNCPIDAVEWPASLEELVFGMLFNNPIVWSTLPASLQSLSFGKDFDQTLAGVERLTSLRQLTVGYNFRQVNAEGCQWPPSLKQLTIGGRFTERLDTLTWPPYLEVLIFGDFFNSPIRGATWPSTLRIIRFGRSFGKTLAGVSWPPRLEELRLGGHYTGCWGIDWPASLTKLTLGYFFYSRLEGLGDSLVELTFGELYNRDIEDVVWPSSLRVLRFGRRFTKDIPESFPSNLRELRFGSEFSGNIDDATVWPFLERLTLSQRLSTPFTDLARWCPELSELTLLSERTLPGETSLADVISWPRKLRKFTLPRTWFWNAQYIPKTVDVMYT